MVCRVLTELGRKPFEKIINRLEKDIFPWIGKRPIASIRAADLLACLRRIESRGALDTAHRAYQNCGQVFRYAVATGRAERDPSSDLRGALPPNDMRCSFNGLQALTRQGLGQDPLSGALYVFVNRRGTQMRVLYFDRSGILCLVEAFGGGPLHQRLANSSYARDELDGVEAVVGRHRAGATAQTLST